MRRIDAPGAFSERDRKGKASIVLRDWREFKADIPVRIVRESDWRELTRPALDAKP